MRYPFPVLHSAHRLPRDGLRSLGGDVCLGVRASSAHRAYVRKHVVAFNTVAISIYPVFEASQHH